MPENMGRRYQHGELLPPYAGQLSLFGMRASTVVLRRASTTERHDTLVAVDYLRRVSASGTGHATLRPRAVDLRLSRIERAAVDATDARDLEVQSGMLEVDGIDGEVVHIFIQTVEAASERSVLRRPHVHGDSKRSFLQNDRAIPVAEDPGPPPISGRDDSSSRRVVHGRLAAVQDARFREGKGDGADRHHHLGSR